MANSIEEAAYESGQNLAERLDSKAGGLAGILATTLSVSVFVFTRFDVPTHGQSILLAIGMGAIGLSAFLAAMGIVATRRPRDSGRARASLLYALDIKSEGMSATSYRIACSSTTLDDEYALQVIELANIISEKRGNLVTATYGVLAAMMSLMMMVILLVAWT